MQLLGNEIAIPSAIKLAKGSYDAIIPIEAICMGGSLRLDIDKVEDLDGQKLVRLRAGNEVIFAKCNELTKDTGVDIDLKKCTFKQGGEGVLSAIPEENRLPFQLKKYRNGKNIIHKLAIGESDIDCDSSIITKIADSFGRDAYKLTFDMLFSTSDVSVGEQGVMAETLETLDYGNDKYLKCSVNSSVVYVKTDNDIEVNFVNLAVQTEKIGVYSPDIDLRLI